MLCKVGKNFATDITLATNKQSNPFFYLTIFTFFRILSKNGGFFRFRRVFSKKKPRKNPGEFFLFCVCQPWIAPTGQPSAQAPQSMHSSGLISYLPPFSEIAPTGQVSAHAPQAMHSSLILCAIVTSPFQICLIWVFPFSLYYHTAAEFARVFKFYLTFI